MRSLNATFYFIAAIILAISGCKDASQPTEPPAAPNLSTMSGVFSQGETFALELEVHFDSGYSWTYELSDTAMLRIDSVSFRPTQLGQNGMPVVGGTSIETFYFHTMMRGQCGVQLTEARGWEKNVPPLRRIQFDITIY